MHGHTLLGDLVVIFAVAVTVVALLRRIGIPSIAGFIVAGILAGPRAFGFVAAPEDVELLAEIGVVLLLFGIGLELSLERVRRLWRPILVGGALQMGLSAVAIAGVARVAGYGWGTAIVPCRCGCMPAASMWTSPPPRAKR